MMFKFKWAPFRDRLVSVFELIKNFFLLKHVFFKTKSHCLCRLLLKIPQKCIITPPYQCTYFIKFSDRSLFLSTSVIIYSCLHLFYKFTTFLVTL